MIWQQIWENRNKTQKVGIPYIVLILVWHLFFYFHYLIVPLRQFNTTTKAQSVTKEEKFERIKNNTPKEIKGNKIKRLKNIKFERFSFYIWSTWYDQFMHKLWSSAITHTWTNEMCKLIYYQVNLANFLQKLTKFCLNQYC